MSEQETIKKSVGHSLSKDEGLTNGGNSVSSNDPDEMTEVCWNDRMIIIVLLQSCFRIKKPVQIMKLILSSLL